MADMNVTVGVKVDKSELQTLDNELKNLENITAEPNFNFQKGLKAAKAAASQVKNMFNIPLSVNFKNNKEILTFMNELKTLSKHVQNAINSGLDMSKFSLGSTSTLSGLNRKMAGEFTAQQNSLLSDLQKQFKDLDIPMPNIDFSNFEQSITEGYKILKSFQDKSRNMVSEVVNNLGERFGNTAAFSKLQSAINNIDWNNFPKAFKEAQTALGTFGNEADVIFTKLNQDSIEFIENLDRVTQQKTQFTLDKTTGKNSFDETAQSIQRIQEAFQTVEAGSQVLKNALKDDNYKGLMNYISEALQKAGVDINKFGGNLDQFLQNVRARFDENGRLVSASVNAMVDDIRLAMNFGTNEQGGLVFGSASVSVETEERNMQKLIETTNKLITLKRQLAQAEAKGNTSTAADIRSEIAAREATLNTLQQEINNRTELNRVMDEYTQRSNRITAQSDDKRRFSEDAESMKQYVSVLNEVAQAQAKIAAKTGKDDFNTEMLTTYRNRIQELMPVLQQLGVAYDEVQNRFTVRGDAQSLSGILNTQQALEKLLQKLDEFRQKTSKTYATQQDSQMNIAYEKAEKALDKVIAKRKELAQAEKSGKMNETGLANMRTDLEKLENALKEAERELERFGNSTRNVKFENLKTEKLQQLDSELNKIQNTTRQTTQEAKSLGDGFNNSFSKMAEFASILGIFDGLQQAISSAKDEIVELNTTMTELQIVTESSDAAMEKTMSGYAQMAKELGVELKTVAEGANEWLNLSWSL